MNAHRILRVGLLLAVTPVVFAGNLTVSGSHDQLQRVSLSISFEQRTVTVTLPADGEAAKVSAENLKKFDLGTNAEGRRVFTAVFSGSPAVNTEDGKIIIADAEVTVAATATPPAKPEPKGGNAAPKTAAAPPKPEDTPKEADSPPVIAAGRVAFTLPADSTLKNRSPSYDAAVPESPAAAAIGSTATLVRLNDGKDANTQLLNISDAEGKIRTGFSFAFHPYRLLAKPTLNQYLHGASKVATDDFSGGKWVRFMSRLDLSLAATVDEPAAGTTDRGATAAVGLAGYVFNRADSRLHLVRRLLQEPETDINAVNPDTEHVQVTTLPSENTTRIVNEVFKTIWNDSYWAFGAAPRLRSNTGSLSDFHSAGVAAWTTLAYGFEGAKEQLGLGFLEDNSQLLLHSSYRDNQEVTDPANSAAKIKEDVWVYGAQLRIGGDDFNVFGEILWEKHHPVGRPRRSTETYFVGFEKRLKEDLWLQLSMGSEENPTSSGRSALVRTALSYAFGDTLMTPAKKEGK